MASRAVDGAGLDIQAVSRVGQILGLFGPETTSLTAGVVAERLGLNRTTAYRYCASLVAAGILERGEERGSFVLGGLLLQLGIEAVARRRVVTVAPPFLRELSTETGVTSVLSVWGSRGPVVALEEEDRSRAVVVSVRPGTQLDPDSAQMRIFLAFHTDESAVRRVLEDVDPALRRRLEADAYDLRRTGWCIATLPDGFTVAAAPVFDGQGLSASMAVLAGDDLIDPTSRDRIVAALRATASSLSDALGARADAPATI
ncbi:IclR family transcriptional regulator [Schumannella soli]|uniref:Helix-turn-helix domain-containing protein n=1 Tax=Schumannella soli TaxID=2590779 RepID=A0A506XXB6_9MICO|nr:helix-turn-helix domain-containing protein [Schumannella soli]TPW77544.1 helix-turn-helix domain-containing protein [Schumannella soli]